MAVVKKRRTNQVLDESKVILAREAVSLKIQLDDLQEKSESVKRKLLGMMAVKEVVSIGKYKVTRIHSETPRLSVESVAGILTMKDFMQSIKVSISELRKYLGEEKIKEIANDIIEKDYITITKEE